MQEAYRNLIVPDAHVALARQITDTLAPVGGASMYTTGLSPDGTAPATHWISSGFIDADYAQLLPLLEWTQDEEGNWIKTVVSAGYPQVIFDLYVAAIQVPDEDPVDPGFTVEDVTAMLDASDVTLEEPFAAMSRMGLQMVQVEEVLIGP